MKRWIAPLVGVLAFVALVWPVLDPGVQLFYRDTGRLYYPVKRYIAERLAQGQLPLWDPWTECGTSLLGQMSPGLLHPWTLLYALPFDLAFKLNHLLPLLLAGIGTYLLSRRLGASRTAAALSGVIFGASGYLVSQASANLIYAVGPAGIPLALERFIALLDRPARGKLVAAAALLALCAYGGEPQSMLICGLIGAAFAIARAISRKQKLLQSAGLTAAWGALALALSAPAALPALAHLRRSERAKGLTQSDLTHFALSPRRLPGLSISSAFNYTPDLWSTLQVKREPTPFEEYFGTVPFAPSIYLGAGALLLACFAMTAGRRGRFLVLGGAIFALAATGENLGIEPILRAIVPGFSLFRYAEKLIAFASLLFAVAAALGLDAAQKQKRALTIAAAILAAGFAGASLLTNPSWLVDRGEQHSAPAAMAFIKALAPGLRQEAAVLAAIALAIHLRPGRAIIAAACGAALLLHGRGLLVTLPVKLFHEQPAFAKKLFDDAGPSAGNWRLYVHPSSDIDAKGLDPKQAALAILREPLRPHFESLFHIEGAANYFSNDDPNYGALLRSDSAPQFFDLLTIAFFVVMPDQLTAAEAKDLGFVQTDFGMWIELLRPAPRARLLDQVEIEPDAAAIGEHLQAVDVSRVALLFPDDAKAAGAIVKGKGTGAAVIARPSPEEIKVAVDAETASILEVGEHFDPGWSAQVDGKPAPVITVDSAILGTVVPAGRHQVTLRYWPAGLTPGLFIALFALGVSCLRRRARG